MGQGDRMQLPNPDEETGQLGRLANVIENADDTSGSSSTGATGGTPAGSASAQASSEDENLDDEKVVPS